MMKKSGWLLFVLIFLTWTYQGCQSGRGNPESEESGLQNAAGGRNYGGIFRINESEYIKNLFPPNITDAYSYRVASQVYEGLFKFNMEDLSVDKGLVENFEVDKTGTIYTFKLIEGVHFHDDPCFPDGQGRELKASDVAYCFTQLCTPNLNNQNFTIFKDILLGANEYYQAAANPDMLPPDGVKGIKVIDDYTIQLTLTEPNSIFTVNLARPGCFIYPKEALEKYGVDMRIKAVGTGPFYITNVDEDISIIMKRNPKYYGKDEFGNQLPFLDALTIQFIKDKKTELFEFKKGNLDMIYRLPTEHIIEILEETATNVNGEIPDYELQRVPEMMTQFLSFMNQGGVFQDVNVRKAFNFAIDRQKILDFVLNGEGFAPGHHGITPPVFSDYNIDSIPGYQLNIDSARYYLNKAGFPAGKNFPAIELVLNPEGQRNTYVAVEIQKQLKDHLNIDLELTILPFAQLMERSFKGNFNLLRIAWVADFPSPENFLWLFNGDVVPDSPEEVSYPNIARYKNPEFDRYYNKALQARSMQEANDNFKNAEITLMRDAPIIVLWYDEGYRLIKSYVENFPNNPMQYRDFSEVYFDNQQKVIN